MIIVLLVVLGLAFGSFCNALVWRLHEQSKTKKKRAASDADLSITTGRSMCTTCHHTLAWYDLIPVLSWLSVRGHCRYCQRAISVQYPAVELLTAALFVASYVFWPLQFNALGVFNFVIWLVALTSFMAMSIYDFRWMILPNKIVYPLIVVTGLQRLVDTFILGNSVRQLLLAMAASMIGGGVFYVLYKLSDGNWIGGGDVKLGFALGFLVGSPLLALLLLFLASVLGLIGAIPSALHGKLNLAMQIPFGPCLMAACVVLVLYGQTIVDWYTRLLIV